MQAKKHFFDPYTQKTYVAGQRYVPVSDESAKWLLDQGAIEYDLAEKATREFVPRQLVPSALLRLPSVMTTTPTIQLGANGGASQITNSVLKASISGDVVSNLFRYHGDMIKAGTTYPDPNFVKNIAKTINNQQWDITIDFDHYGSEFEILEKGLNNKCRILIDEGYGYELAHSGTLSGGPADGGLYLRWVDFGVAKLRRIRIEYYLGYFGGIRIGPNDTLFPPSRPAGKRAIFMGDSFTEGGSSGFPQGLSYGAITSVLLGWEFWNSGVGATGYINPGPAGRVKFQDRVQHDVIGYNPDVVVIAGGINDESYTYADVLSASDLLFKTVREGLPNTEIYVVGPWSPGTATAARKSVRDALQVSALKYGLPFIDPIAGITYCQGNAINNAFGEWVTGSGNAGISLTPWAASTAYSLNQTVTNVGNVYKCTTAGTSATSGGPTGTGTGIVDGTAIWAYDRPATGNSFLFTSSDGTHPTPDGHSYLGERLATEILKIYRRL
ncbi:GDSL-type esterase/lipase family protein [Paenibacillus alkalitolerans]|uniref:GDSL-type esterase/lipase family protein n=1 Tax=Paenibacillus alkalitolerans TaxID=2799335 RepID=UPI0018F75534|nr:GDSL-type esterase/lipase family protein [Paenibacillus alkalitolerans]